MGNAYFELFKFMNEHGDDTKKKEEPVKPKREVNENGQILSCGNCGAWFTVQKQRYCHECGMAVKWDD